VGGAGGDPGNPGEGGPGGPGGNGDASTWGATYSQGSEGPKGPDGVGNLGVGQTGSIGRNLNMLSILNLNEVFLNRSALIDKWSDFHRQRSFELYLEDSLRLILSTEKTRQEAAELRDKNFAAFMSEVDEVFLNDIINTWEQSFIKELDSAIQEKPLERIVRLKSQAVDFVNTLKTMKDSTQPEKTLHLTSQNIEEASKNRKSALEAGIESCLNYNNTLKKLLLSKAANEIFASLEFLQIPVCLGQPDLSRKENVFANIVLGGPLTAKVVPETWSSFFVSQVQKQPHDSWLQSILNYLFPKAWAQEFVNRMVKFMSFNTKNLETGMDIKQPLTNEGAIFLGYEVPNEKRMTRETLQYFLKVLAQSEIRSNK